MDSWLKALVAVTCVAVLVALGTLAVDRWVDGRVADRAEEAAAAREEQERVECERIVSAWDAKNFDAVLAEYGENNAAMMVSACRGRLGIPRP